MSWFEIEDLQHLEIELTSHCNARCPMCSRQILGTYNENPKLTKKHLPKTSVLALIPQLAKCRNVEVGFIGAFGDPLMHPDLLDLTEAFCKESNINVLIETNGAIRSQKFWANLGQLSKESGNLKLTFSIDGLEKTNAIYRANTDFQKIMQNSQTYIDHGGWASWKFICFKHNQHEVDIARRRAQHMGFKKFIAHHTPRWKSTSQSLKGTPYVLQPSDKAMENRSQMKFALQVEDDIKCRGLARNMLFINYRNQVWPCSFFSVEYELGKPFTEYWKRIEEIFGQKFNNLENISLEQFLAHPFLQKKLPRSWDRKSSGTPICGRFCGGTHYWKQTK